VSIDSFVPQAALDSESSRGVSATQTSRHAESRTRADRSPSRALGAPSRAEAAPAPQREPIALASQASAGTRDLPQALAPGAYTPGAGTPSRAAPRPEPDAAPAGDMRELLRRLAIELGEDVFERYFLGQTRIARAGDALLVTVTSSYLAQLLDRRFGEQLLRATGASTLRFDVDRSVFTAPAASAAMSREAAPAPIAAPRPRPAGRATPQPAFRHSLRDFVVGHANRLALTAVTRLIEAPDASAPGTNWASTPVFLHGACGLGKTHLLQGACARFLELRPGANVRYVTGENFTNDFIQSVRNNRVDGFRKTYRGVDLLCIDDIHFLTSKDATQQELLHTFDAVGLSGARILIASDEHPREIRKLSEKLVSRFLACCVVRLDTPDASLRKDLIRHLAARRMISLEAEAIDVLAQRSAKAIGSLGGFGGSVRELEGLLNQVEAMARLLPDAATANGQLGPAMVRRALGIEEHAMRAGTVAGSLAARRPIAIRTIIEQVCKALSVDVGEFAGKGRHKRVVFARSISSHLCRQLTTQSFPEIARAMGRPNHSTVITAQRRLQKQLDADASALVEPELVPQHPGVSHAELLEFLTSQIRTASR
jgi:chromosomal replication initiator protein